MADAPAYVVRFGGGSWPTQGGRLTTSINDLPRAEFGLEWEEIRDRPPDYLAEVTVELDGRSVFTGNVLRAEPRTGLVWVECGGGVAMTETPMSPTSAAQFPAQDLVYAAARGAGYDDDHVRIQGLDELPVEPIEVMIALEGTIAASTFGSAGIAIRAPETARAALERFYEVPNELEAAFRQAEAVAVFIREGQRMWSVEQRALHQTRLSLAWLATRARYGYALAPDGTAAAFDRKTSRALPRVGGAIVVRGLRTQRRWIRDPREPRGRDPVDISEVPRLLQPALPEGVSPLTAMAIIRAADAFDGEPTERALAFFDAWEFYVGDEPARITFSKDELERLRNELPASLPRWLSSAQGARIVSLVDLANSRSLRDKMRTALERDGVSLSGDEDAVLRRLRKARNRVAHGRESPGLTPDDLEWGCSILSRALVHRVAAEGQRGARY